MELAVVLFTAVVFFGGGFTLGAIWERNKYEVDVVFFPDPDPNPIPAPEEQDEEQPRLRLVA